MQRLGLSAADMRVFHQTLLTGYERKITAEIRTLDGVLTRHLSMDVLDGQVDVDVSAEVSRILTLRFLDEARSLHFEPNSAGGAPLHRSRIIQIGYSVRVPDLSRWVTVPVFAGPLWDFRRQGAEVSIVAHGMERQALGERWSPVRFAKKSRKTDAIKRLLADCGETRLGAIPDLSATFPDRFAVTRWEKSWIEAKHIAASMDHHLFHDGAGIPRLRPFPSRPSIAIGTGTLLDDPSIGRTVDGLVNIVEVFGANPKGPKPRVHAVAALPPGHPNSPQSLARNGKPLHLALKVENTHLKTVADCFTHARRLRDEHARTPVQIGFDALPLPHLDEYDLVAVVTEEGTMPVRMNKWTIPLAGSEPGGADGPPMTVGQNRRTVKARSRRHHKKGHR